MSSYQFYKFKPKINRLQKANAVATNNTTSGCMITAKGLEIVTFHLLNNLMFI